MKIEISKENFSSGFFLIEKKLIWRSLKKIASEYPKNIKKLYSEFR